MGGCSSQLADKNSGLPVIHTEQTLESLTSKKIPLTLVLMDGSRTTVSAPVTLTPKQLTDQIGERFNKKSPSGRTVVQLQRKTLRADDDSRKLSQFGLPAELQPFQRDPCPKRPTTELNSHQTANLDDFLNQQLSMPCGHKFTQQDILDQLKKQLRGKAQVIKCPAPTAHGLICEATWQEEDWSQAAALTQQQLEQISQALRQNKIQRQKRVCSFCCHLSRLGHSSNEKRICSVCESAFCPGCLNFWRGKRGADCRDQKCKFIRDLLEGTPQSLKFHLFKKDTREQEVIRVPRIRACPRCGLLIETRVASDKRARCVCVNMGYSFCLVCLSLVDGSGRSDCGAFYEVCSPKSKGEA